MSVPISVIIPVGPKPHHRKWLHEMIDSICSQTELPGELIVVDDGGDLDDREIRYMVGPQWGSIATTVYRLPCNLGVVAALNVGVAVAAHDLAVLGCADDKLLPNCIAKCWESWQGYKEQLGYYYLGVKYSDGREQNAACGAAMVTKELWRRSGGFPPQAAVGAADHIFIHGMLVASYQKTLPVKIIRVSRELTYWYRAESNGETSRNCWPAIEAIKIWYGDQWTKKENP